MKKQNNAGINGWKRKVLVITLLFFISALAGTCAFAAGGELPPADSFRPDADSFDAAGVIVSVIVFIAGIAASVYFAIGMIKVVVKDVKELVSGEASLKDKQSRFMAIGVAFIILLLVITGKWYDVLSVIWNKLCLPIINKLS
ncbi:MAG: hypothetical protein JL50_01170 [Peptococcaceae bacterium BICA1-7]|nr:MAG: hypothetical protein JL50_01170 [Peptococcaceae bacterium BICA1-7]HBV98000.1 hypothetical protein [Desulfotomaculum sp.]